MRSNTRGSTLWFLVFCLSSLVAYPRAGAAAQEVNEKIGEAKPERITPPAGKNPESGSLVPPGKRKLASKAKPFGEKSSLSHKPSKPNGPTRSEELPDEQHRNERKEGKHGVAHEESREHEDEAHDSCDLLYPYWPAEAEKCKKARGASDSKSRK